MGFEVRINFHPRKEEGGYDMGVKNEEIVKVGKPFDDTPLERLAGVVMSLMARRDVFVIAEEIEITELIRHQIGFKECKDGKGIVLKNKKFSFNEAAQLVAEDMGQPDARPQPQEPHIQQAIVPVSQNGQMVIHSNGNGQYHHPHEVMAVQRPQNNIDDLYGNPNKPVPIARGNEGRPMLINQKKVLYKVYIDRDNAYGNEYRRLPAKLSLEKEYPVHAVIPSASGRLDAQRLAITDDSGKVAEVEEKYFTSVGLGLVEDQGGRFSGNNNRRSGVRKPKLAFEDEMFMDGPDPSMAGRAIPHNIPVDDGTIPEHLLQMPEIRRGRRM